jgi:hypothetical protein
MGLFSTISTSAEGPQTSSSNIPTVVQLYTDKPIQLDTTSKVTGYTALTYQAVQVGSSSEEEEVKNRHQAPDLGVWNCRVKNETALVDSLLAKVGQDVRTFCWTVNLSDESLVEPTVTLLQSALVRHLIENPPPPTTTTTTVTDDSSEAAVITTPVVRQTATTSLYQLQATQFGLASEDKQPTVTNINDSCKEIKTTVMICAIMPSADDVDSEVSELAYKKKQAVALIMYHLRKFAAAIHASLCFVEAEAPTLVVPSSQPSSPSKESQQRQEQQQPPRPSSSSAVMMVAQPAVNHDKLSQLWRDLALDQTVWDTVEEETPLGEDDDDDDAAPIDVASTPVYGPGRHQEDLIESVLLRNAHYPGHWDAQKDSLWVALPTPSEASTDVSGLATGDEGWLTQLRGSIASAEAPRAAAAAEETKEDKKPKEKDAAVSSFFESLLKKP